MPLGLVGGLAFEDNVRREQISLSCLVGASGTVTLFLSTHFMSMFCADIPLAFFQHMHLCLTKHVETPGAGNTAQTQPFPTHQNDS